MSAKLLITLLIVIALISNSFGDDIAKRLVKRYKSGKEKCYDKRKNERPAYECSGIMIRGVNPKLKLAWNMKEMNKHKKAFSLAYLRHDQVFSRFPGDYKSGFIIYPHMNTPRKKNKYKMYCSFPLDGWTDYRDGHGCGISQQFKDPSTNHCRRQNIKSFDKWKSHFKKIVEKHTRRQCGFDLTRKSAAKYFAISIAAKKYIQSRARYSKYAVRNNELRMHSWNEKKPKNIPIEAFFYLLGSAAGKRNAEKYQDQFYSRGGGAVPVVGIRLPTAKKGFKVKHVKRKPRKVK